ncbi:MAG TPA: hypothetical protein VNA67_01425 [Pseudonocardiaceae bacterium]|nr:hypothetical protein [Pseudonocardiaceae bacterium]
MYWLRSSSACKNVGQQLVGAELAQGPPESGDPAGAAGDIGPPAGMVWRGRGEEADGRERLGGQAQPGVVAAQLVVEAGFCVVEEQQILALDAEHQRLGVNRSPTQHTAAQDRVEQEQHEAGLGRHAGDAADRDMTAAGAIEELEVDVDRITVAAKTTLQRSWTEAARQLPSRLAEELAETAHRGIGRDAQA